MNVLLRSASLLALAVAALSASAQVRYDFSGSHTNAFGTSTDAFTLVLPSFVTSTTTFTAAQLRSSSATTNNGTTGTTTITGVTFRPSYNAGSPDGVVDYVTVSNLFSDGVTTNPYDLSFYFSQGSFASFGGHNNGSLRSDPASLAVQAVPEPSAFAALGLGALAFAKRRKRA